MPGAFGTFMGSAGGQAAVQGGFSIGGNLFSAREAKKQNRRNLKLYRENRDWEEMMHNTEWQRGVNDMRAAGINPMLAVSQGGASTPNVAPAHVEKEEGMSKVMESVSKNPQTLLDMQQRAANVKLTLASAYKVQKEGDRTAFENNPVMMGEDWDRKVEETKARIREMAERANLAVAEREKLNEMLPVMVALEKARRVLTDEQSTSARQSRRLEAYSEEELKATERWFQDMGASGRLMEFINKAIMMLGRGR